MAQIAALVMLSFGVPACLATSSQTAPLPSSLIAGQSRETISQLATLWLTSATEHWVRTDPNFAHALFRRMDEVYLASELRDFAQHSITLLTSALGPEHTETLLMEYDLGLALMKENDFQQALTKLTSLVAKQDRVLGQEHPYTLKTSADIGLCLLCLTRYEESLSWSEVTLVAELKNNGGVDNRASMKVRNAMVYALYALGNWEEAWAMNAAMLTWTEAELTPADEVYILARNARAMFLAAEERLGEAKKEYKSLLELYSATLGKEHENTLEAKMRLSKTCWDLGEGKEAIKIREELLHTLKNTGRPIPIQFLKVEEELEGWKDYEMKLQKLEY